jgi:hypothetical protein
MAAVVPGGHSSAAAAAFCSSVEWGARHPRRAEAKGDEVVQLTSMAAVAATVILVN